tara:strand:- start:736 stop:1497 length:762 start_codon:yes stop_codon:yes gene_type:complete
MKVIFQCILVIFISFNLYSREKGETEITSEDGIEVFQDEQYYLLKENVTINSDSFYLNANKVRVNFDKNLYDITELRANGNINFDSPQYEINGSGEILNFQVKTEKIKIEGIGSKLVTKDIEMLSDGFIEVNNENGNFTLSGFNSKLINEKLIIRAEYIDGTFLDKIDKKEISFLNVVDKKISYVKNNETEMYAKKIVLNNDSSIIELIDNVTIIRDSEKITGDYATLDTKNNSYKIKSNNKTKVKLLIKNDE